MKMNRLEQIKRRLELSLRSPSEYGHLMSNPEANIEYLIGLLEDAEKALERICTDPHTHRPARDFAFQVLKSIQGEG